ncbi:hypothetical protein L7F22_056997 [Adiantum nelumboides]|nr:hypothetical protein [Adiantum nelumboides]
MVKPMQTRPAHARTANSGADPTHFACHMLDAIASSGLQPLGVCLTPHADAHDDATIIEALLGSWEFGGPAEDKDLAVDDDPTATFATEDPKGHHAVFPVASKDKCVAAEDENHAAKVENDAKVVITISTPPTSLFLAPLALDATVADEVSAACNAMVRCITPSAMTTVSPLVADNTTDPAKEAIKNPADTDGADHPIATDAAVHNIAVKNLVAIAFANRGAEVKPLQSPVVIVDKAAAVCDTFLQYTNAAINLSATQNVATDSDETALMEVFLASLGAFFSTTHNDADQLATHGGTTLAYNTSIAPVDAPHGSSAARLPFAATNFTDGPAVQCPVVHSLKRSSTVSCVAVPAWSLATEMAARLATAYATKATKQPSCSIEKCVSSNTCVNAHPEQGAF